MVVSTVLSEDLQCSHASYMENLVCELIEEVNLFKK